MRRFIMATIAAASAAGGVTWTISASIAVDGYKKMHYARDDFQFFWHGQFLPSNLLPCRICVPQLNL